jgi:lipid II:glycine glycyltransferase (peptidoglycan interpeptide bridge formation enzyme)
MEVKLVNPVYDPEWDRLAISHPNYGFSHSAAWARVLSKTYGHEPVYLGCSRRGELAALIPMMEVRSPLTGRRGVCLPFTDFCGPLEFGEGASGFAMGKLTEVALERQWKYFELRGGRTFQPSTTPGCVFYGHALDLRRGTEDLFARFRSSVRRALRKAGRSGLGVQVTRNREAVLDFYRLHTQTRRRHGLPPQPLSFFLNIHDEIIKAGFGFVVMATKGSHPIAAAVFFHFGKNAVYKFCASDDRYQQFRGNNLVLWEGIRFLTQHGAETLHLGRTSRDNIGLRRFKLTWGTEEETIEYRKFSVAGGASVISRHCPSGLHDLVFGSLPLVVNRLAGSIIYPHLD